MNKQKTKKDELTIFEIILLTLGSLFLIIGLGFLIYALKLRLFG